MMNLPNYITLARIILIPFFIDLMIYGYYRGALAVFAIACVTDALDGMIARLTHSQTELGAFLDPMADKLLIVSAFVTLVLLHMLPICRDVILVIGSAVIYFTGHDLKARPSIVGKATTVLQLTVVTLSLLLKSYGVHVGLMSLLFWITTVFTMVSGIQYVTRGMKIVGEDASDRIKPGGRS
jgi:cardiolipin synthase